MRYAAKNITDLSSVSGASLSLHIAISLIAVAISMHERPGKLWEASTPVHFIRHFARPFLPRVREIVPGFAKKFIERPKMQPRSQGLSSSHKREWSLPLVGRRKTLGTRLPKMP